MDKRQRLNLTLTTQRIRQLRKLKERYGASSLCRVVYVILSALESYADRHPRRTMAAPVEVEDDVTGMFDEYSDKENIHAL